MLEQDWLTLIDSAVRIDSQQRLRERYQPPLDRALRKEVLTLTRGYRAYVERAPFVMIGSVGEAGVDLSPRGDAPGFVRVVNERTLLLPDRRGNNRLDTLSNLVRDPRVSLLFMIPGIGETLRVKGRAQVLASDALCEAFAVGGKPASAVLRVDIDRVYFQCQKALARSALWQPDRYADRADVPTAGAMQREIIGAEFDGAAYDAGYPEYMKKTLY